MISLRYAVAALIMPLACAATIVQAGEGQKTAAFPGFDGILTGFVPGPGLYVLQDYQHFSSHSLKGNDGKGNPLVQNFRVEADIVSSRVFYQSDMKLLGANLGAQLLLAGANVNTRQNGFTDSDFKFGDLAFEPVVLNWSNGALNVIATTSIKAPTGDYNRGRQLSSVDVLTQISGGAPILPSASIGSNYWTIAPELAFTLFLSPSLATAAADPSKFDISGWELSGKAQYLFNTTNTEAQYSLLNPGGNDYKSGDVFVGNLTLSYIVNRDLQVGVNGYAIIQTTDDRISGTDPVLAGANAIATQLSQLQGGPAVSLPLGAGGIRAAEGNRAEVYGVGPTVRTSIYGLPVFATYQHEFGAYNINEGERFSLRAVAKF